MIYIEMGAALIVQLRAKCVQEMRHLNSFKATLHIMWGLERFHIWYLKTSDGYTIDVSFSFPPLSHFPKAAELTGWHRHTVVSQSFLMLLAQRRHVNQLNGWGHWQKFIWSHSSQPDTTEVGIWELISNDESEGSPWFLSWEILIRGFLLKVRVGRKKEESTLIYFLLW